jgi:hypothetical protein
LAAARKTYVDNRPVGRPILVKPHIVAYPADGPPDSRFGFNVLIEHVQDGAQFGNERLYRSENCCLIFTAVLIKPWFVVVLAKSR